MPVTDQAPKQLLTSCRQRGELKIQLYEFFDGSKDLRAKRVLPMRFALKGPLVGVGRSGGLRDGGALRGLRPRRLPGEKQPVHDLGPGAGELSLICHLESTLQGSERLSSLLSASRTWRKSPVRRKAGALRAPALTTTVCEPSEALWAVLTGLAASAGRRAYHHLCLRRRRTAPYRSRR